MKRRVNKPSYLRNRRWLHGLRYFLRFCPAGEHVTMAKLLDAKGKVIAIVHSEEGVIEGFMSV
jgi:hypothetical protein